MPLTLNARNLTPEQKLMIRKVAGGYLSDDIASNPEVWANRNRKRHDLIADPRYWAGRIIQSGGLKLTLDILDLENRSELSLQPILDDLGFNPCADMAA